MSNENSETSDVAVPIEQVTINLRNINTGDNAIVKCDKGSSCKPIDLYHKAGWSFVKEDAVIMVMPGNQTVTPTVPRTFNEGDTLILSNKGTSAGL